MDGGAGRLCCNPRQEAFTLDSGELACRVRNTSVLVTSQICERAKGGVSPKNAKKRMLRKHVREGRQLALNKITSVDILMCQELRKGAAGAKHARGRGPTPPALLGRSRIFNSLTIEEKREMKSRERRRRGWVD